MQRKAPSHTPNKFQMFLILIFSAFTLLMTIIAPIELNMVKQARNWQQVNALVVGAEYKQAPFNRGSQYLEFRLIDTETMAEFAIVDARPGDFPISISILNSLTYDSSRKLLNLYKNGDQIRVLRSPDSRKYFFDAGNYRLMAFLLALSLAWWGYVAWHIIQRRKMGY
jgi:hypothetical protein